MLSISNSKYSPTVFLFYLLFSVVAKDRLPLKQERCNKAVNKDGRLITQRIMFSQSLEHNRVIIRLAFYFFPSVSEIQ